MTHAIITTFIILVITSPCPPSSASAPPSVLLSTSLPPPRRRPPKHDNHHLLHQNQNHLWHRGHGGHHHLHHHARHPFSERPEEAKYHQSHSHCHHPHLNSHRVYLSKVISQKLTELLYSIKYCCIRFRSENLAIVKKCMSKIFFMDVQYVVRYEHSKRWLQRKDMKTSSKECFR